LGKLSDHDDGLIFMLTIDGVHCPIEEPRPFSTANSSHKFGGNPGVNYEVGLQINQPKLIWVHGPTQPGRYNDISVFRLKLKGEMEDQVPGRKAIGDKGYRGEPELISTKNEFDPAELAEFKDRAMARHETFNQRLKCYKCLATMWRHKKIPHEHAFRAVCAIVVYQIQSGGTTLFDAYL
jgi:DDE superfamily endonuclease